MLFLKPFVLRSELLVLFLKPRVLPSKDPDGGGGQNAGADLNHNPDFAELTSGWPGTILADTDMARLVRVLLSLAEMVALIRARSALVTGHQLFPLPKEMSLPQVTRLRRLLGHPPYAHRR
ncbi:hypothetical protein ABT248_29350 [Streptomyces sp. NPDC000971]|uniref:hypothetical protein n=1 Tax=Streptomyces TaxID=1883 RepID=UPI00331B524B